MLQQVDLLELSSRAARQEKEQLQVRRALLRCAVQACYAVQAGPAKAARARAMCPVARMGHQTACVMCGNILPALSTAAALCCAPAAPCSPC